MERKEIEEVLRVKKMENRIAELEESMKHLLEVQVKPSTEFADEWREAVIEARKVLRDKIGGE